MPDFSKFSFWDIIAFVVPGFLIYQSYYVAAQGKPESITKDGVIPYLMLSTFYVLFLWYQGYALQSGSSISQLDPQKLVFLYVLLPIAIGGVAGLIVGYDVLRRIMKALGIPVAEPPPPIRTPWPVVIPKIPVGAYLIVTLKDGRVYNTMVTADSHFSSDPTNIDLYLGQTFSLTSWTPSNPQRGVYIRGSEIQSIEIIR